MNEPVAPTVRVLAASQAGAPQPDGTLSRVKGDPNRPRAVKRLKIKPSGGTQSLYSDLYDPGVQTGRIRRATVQRATAPPPGSPNWHLDAAGRRRYARRRPSASPLDRRSVLGETTATIRLPACTRGSREDPKQLIP